MARPPASDNPSGLERTVWLVAITVGAATRGGIILRGRKVYSPPHRLFGGEPSRTLRAVGQVGRANATTGRSSRQEKEMSRSACYSLALLAALTVSSGAYARTHHDSPLHPGAHASAAGTSQADIRQQCAEEARARWGTNSQDMQTPRDFAYRNCMFDRGMRNP